MAVSFDSVATASFTAVASGGNLTITKPTGLAVGDYLVAHLSMVITSGSNGNWDTPSGWTSLVNENQSADVNCEARLTVFYKVADSSDAAASNFSFTTNSANTYSAGALYRISGVSAIAGTIAEATLDTTPTFTNTITPSFASSGLLFLTTVADAGETTGSVASYAITTSSPTWTEAYDFVGSEGAANGTNRQGLMAGATATRTEVTATGDSTCTYTNFQQNSVGAIVVLTPVVSVSNSVSALSITASVPTPAVTGTASVTVSTASLTVSIPTPTVSTPTPDWDTTDKSASSSWTTTTKS